MNSGSNLDDGVFIELSYFIFVSLYTKNSGPDDSSLNTYFASITHRHM